MQTKHQGRKASWLNTHPPWHEFFFCDVFYTESSWGTRGGYTALLPVQLLGQLRTAPVKNSCAKHVLSSLPSLQFYRRKTHKQAFRSNGCCQVSGILWVVAVKAFFKPKGLSEERAAVCRHQLCSAVTRGNKLKAGYST